MHGCRSLELHSTGVMRRSASASLAASPLVELTHGFQRGSKKAHSSSAARPTFHAKQFYHTPFEEAYSDLAKQRNLRKLFILFEEADADGSGEMSLDEFREAMQKPWILRTFAALGVQPHQSDLLFRCMVQGTQKTELSIHEFIEGLTTLIGTASDGTSKEIDVGMLRPTREAKLQRQCLQPPHASHVLPSGLQKSASGIGLNLPPVHFLPEDAVRCAFVHSATAKAIHPPSPPRSTKRR